jgi:hypothetical protein
MSTTLQPSAPPLYPKPDTQWDVLCPLETTTKAICRRIGQLFVGVGFASGLGRYVAARRLTGTPDFIINTCYALVVISVASLVGGAVLWFFNRSEVSFEHLRQERIKIGNEIHALTVAGLYTKAETFHASIFPKEELNEWIQYFLSETSFEIFLHEQTRGIYALPLDDTTKGLLKDRAIAYFQQSHNPITLLRLRALPLYGVLDAEGKDHLDKLIANREAEKLPYIVNAHTYTEFIGQHGVEVLSCLNLEYLQRLQMGFAAEAYQSGKGILALENDRAKELAVFGEVNKTSLFQGVANREASQSYPVFIKRNGIPAIGMVTDMAVGPKLSQSFITHVVALRSGLVGIKELFKQEINLFGIMTYAPIEREVLRDETTSLENRAIDYKEFRTRNGFVNNLFYRPYFLALPYADLVALKYEPERTQWQVTHENIRETLNYRWQGMPLKDVLATDAKGFLASMQGSSSYFSPREWTVKAVDETQNLLVREVITTYGCLFIAGVLTPQDGQLNDRLLTEIAFFTSWERLFNAYSPFVFKYFLISTSKKVVELVRNFISANAESFLTESYDATILRYVWAIERNGLDSFCKELLAAKRKKKARAEETYSAWLLEREEACNKKIQTRQKQAKQTIAEIEALIDLPAKKQRKEKAKKNHAKLDASYRALESSLRQGGERLLQMMVLIQEKQTRLSALEQELQRLQAYAPQFQYQVQAGRAQSVEIALVMSEIGALRLEHATKQDADAVNQKQLPVLAEQLKGALDEQRLATSSYTEAVLELSQKKDEIEKECTRAVEQEQFRKQTDITRERGRKDQTLGEILRSLKEKIQQFPLKIISQ